MTEQPPTSESTPIIILGLDVHGIECVDILSRTGNYHCLGFISQHAGPPDTYGGYPVLGGEEAIDRYPSAGLVPLHVWKSKTHRRRWVSLIDRDAFVSATARVGQGCVIYPHCFIGANAVVGDAVLMLSGCVVNHDNHIGDGAVLASRVTLAGGVTVGQDAYLGQGCLVRQHLRIGENAFVGMGAVVLRDVAAHTTVIGNPARLYQQKN